MEHITCKGQRANGERCRSTAIGPDGYCFAHSPANSPEAKRAARAKGGANRSTAARATKALPASMQDVASLILRSLSAVEAGTMRAGQAQAIAALAGAYVRVHEAGEVTARIDALEAALNGRRLA